MNTAIIVAAGSGSRFNSDIPKQFHQILGRPVIVHTIERFDQCHSVDEIVLVLSEDQIENFRTELARFHFSKNIKIAAGGPTRAHSVANGLANADPEAEVVAVHDGARPVVTVEEIERTINKAAETGAACLVAPVTDTIKQVDGDHIVGTLDRRSLRRALTPQAFRLEILRQAFADEQSFDDATDECFLVEQLGVEIATVPGSSRNIKITFPDDLLLAELFLKEVYR
ncbi:MAG: 2-C-methyl-D-erythritol 4-phosphate cytidylyltransferase [Pyrinomonadaceae bacterium]|nr:2-C-methyl-D-erythritol 4-phosphate cytidylyltransferase [Pyrinomonadaceae bacterium]